MVGLDVGDGVVVGTRADVGAALLSALADLVDVRLGVFIEDASVENMSVDLDA